MSARSQDEALPTLSSAVAVPHHMTGRLQPARSEHDSSATSQSRAPPASAKRDSSVVQATHHGATCLQLRPSTIRARFECHIARQSASSFGRAQFERDPNAIRAPHHKTKRLELRSPVALQAGNLQEQGHCRPKWQSTKTGPLPSENGNLQKQGHGRPKWQSAKTGPLPSKIAICKNCLICLD